MENENIVVNEPTPEVVSNEPQPEEFKLPQTKEEYDKLVKSAVNKANTEILKSLNVKSIKEFKELQASVLSEKDSITKITGELEDYKTKYSTLNNSYEELTRETVLDKHQVQSEYKSDITKLALDNVSDEKTFEQAVSELVNGRYKYATSNTLENTFRVGVEKTSPSNKTEAEKYMESNPVYRKYLEKHKK